MIMVIAILLFICSNSFATNYYVSNSGNDGNPGTLASPWATISHVNNATFSPHDTIFFAKGGIWRETLSPYSGTASGRVVYSSYGTGNKPQILGSYEANSTSDWTNTTGNIWVCSAAVLTSDVGNIVYNNSICGVKHSDLTDLFLESCELPMTTQGDFWYDNNNHQVQVYSVGNPASYYTDIEICYASSGISMFNKSYITLNGLDIRFVSDVGIRLTGTCTNITIRYCDTKFIGGTEYNYHGGYRQGNAIQFWARDQGYNDVYNNIDIFGCNIDETYDTGFSFQGGSSTGSATFTNIYFHHNIIVNSEWPLEYWIAGSNSLASNIRIENNTTIDAGGQQQHAQRWGGGQASHFMLWGMEGTYNNIYVRNNIFSTVAGINNSGSGWCAISLGTLALASALTIDYNYFQLPDHTNDNAWYGTIMYAYDYYYPLNSWQNATSKDLHSLYGDPLFTNRSSNDYNLQSNSPCINTGVDCGYSTDYYGNAITGTPDIGAIEYGATAPPPVNNYSGIRIGTFNNKIGVYNNRIGSR